MHLITIRLDAITENYLKTEDLPIEASYLGYLTSAGVQSILDANSYVNITDLDNRLSESSYININELDIRLFESSYIDAVTLDNRLSSSSYIDVTTLDNRLSASSYMTSSELDTRLSTSSYIDATALDNRLLSSSYIDVTTLDNRLSTSSYMTSSELDTRLSSSSYINTAALDNRLLSSSYIDATALDNRLSSSSYIDATALDNRLSSSSYIDATALDNRLSSSSYIDTAALDNRLSSSSYMTSSELDTKLSSSSYMTSSELDTRLSSSSYIDATTLDTRLTTSSYISSIDLDNNLESSSYLANNFYDFSYNISYTKNLFAYLLIRTTLFGGVKYTIDSNDNIMGDGIVGYYGDMDLVNDAIFIESINDVMRTSVPPEPEIYWTKVMAVPNDFTGTYILGCYDGNTGNGYMFTGNVANYIGESSPVNIVGGNGISLADSNLAKKITITDRHFQDSGTYSGKYVYSLQYFNTSPSINANRYIASSGSGLSNTSKAGANTRWYMTITNGEVEFNNISTPSYKIYMYIDPVTGESYLKQLTNSNPSNPLPTGYYRLSLFEAPS